MGGGRLSGVGVRRLGTCDLKRSWSGIMGFNMVGPFFIWS